MSKFVNVPNGDFTVKVQDNGTIRLDTGAGIGEVRVTGNLVIEGTTTTVNSTNLEIEDNILTLNRGETSNGVGEGTAGIQIDRGTASDGDAQILFDESIEHVNPNAPATQVYGTFKFVRTDGQMVGIRAPSIQSGGGSMYLDTQDNPILVTGSYLNYHNNIVNQDLDEALVHKYYVDTYVDATLNDLQISRIASGNTIVEATDATDGLNESRVDFMMDSSVVSTFFPDRIELNEIRIKNSTISGTVSNGDLELEAPGTGTVLIKDVLQIAETPGTDDFAIDPLAPTNGVKVYAKSEGPGNTGLYYVNTNNERDELISRNRALLFGYLL